MSDKKTIRDRVVDPGYRLPATIEPGEDVCIRVYVPKDSLYLAAFWAQYEKLGMWLSWERGGTRAKDAASAWKVRIAKAREINDCAEGDCGIMDVRQKPDYPCILQKWDDCESEWVDFADITLCSQAIPEPFQEYPEDEVHDAIGTFKSIVEQIDVYLDDGKSSTEIKIIMSGLISSVPGIAGMIDSMAAKSGSERQSAIDGMNWQNMSDSVFCDRSECHLENFGLYDIGTTQWVVCLMRNIENWAAGTAGDVADWAADFINGVIPKGFLDIINIFPDSGAFLDPASCSWELVYDFTLGDQLGWSAYNANTTVWDGTGWHDGYPNEKTEDGVSISSPVMPAVRIRKVELYLDIVMEGTNPSAALYRYYSSWSQWKRTYDNLQVYTWSGLDWTPNGTSERINVNIDEYTGGPNTHTDARIVKVIVYYGDN